MGAGDWLQSLKNFWEGVGGGEMTNGLAFLVLLQTAYSVLITRREINLSPTLYGGRFYQSDDLCI